jgi:glutaredoxin
MTGEAQTTGDRMSGLTVTLYVVPSCPLCASARHWLERHHIRYVERDVANDFGALRAMHRLTRQRLVPVFEARGRALVRPSEEELAELLLSES